MSIDFTAYQQSKKKKQYTVHFFKDIVLYCHEYYKLE